MSTSALDLVVRKVGQDAGLKLSAHQLRHTLVTSLVRKGYDLVLVAEIAGHKKLETTKRYSLTTSEDKEKALHALAKDDDWAASTNYVPDKLLKAGCNNFRDHALKLSPYDSSAYASRGAAQCLLGELLGPTSSDQGAASCIAAVRSFREAFRLNPDEASYHRKHMDTAKAYVQDKIPKEFLPPNHRPIPIDVPPAGTSK